VKILVCGAGSIGKRHIENLKKIGVTVLAWRSRKGLAEILSKQYKIRVYTSINEAIDSADGVVVATTTNTHIEIAIKVIERNKALFIEKPLSDSYRKITPFLEKIKENHIIEVGFQLRAHPNLIKLNELIKKNEFGPLYTYRAVVGQRLDQWRPGTDYKKSYSANRDQGGGALLDLTHEIDLIQWLTGPVNGVYANLSTVSDLEMNAEDLVNLILINTNNAVGQIQLDMLSPVYRRELELVFQKAILHWDAVKGILKKTSAAGTVIEHQVANEFNRNDMFMSQMKHFVGRISDASLEPLCSIQSGVAVQKIVEAAIVSNQKKINIKVGSI
jgi:predicted dehydrogenase